MGNRLDSIIKHKYVEGPLAISEDYTTEHFDISGQEGSLSVQVDYSEGASLSMTLYIEVSTNGRSFSRIEESGQTVSDSSGTHIWDITEVGIVYMRVALVVNSGSCTIDEIQLSAKRRH